MARENDMSNHTDQEAPGTHSSSQWLSKSQTVSAAEWCASAPRKPVTWYRRLNARNIGEFEVIEETNAPRKLERRLRKLGFGPRFSRAQKLGVIETHYEIWVSKDGVTTITFLAGLSSKKIDVDKEQSNVFQRPSIESRTSDAHMLLTVEQDVGSRIEGFTYLPLLDDLEESIREHRAALREQMSGGHKPLRIDEPQDRDAWWQFYTEQYSSRKSAMARVGVLGLRWGGLVAGVLFIALILVLFTDVL